jgi:hypothetical protein
MRLRCPRVRSAGGTLIEAHRMAGGPDADWYVIAYPAVDLASGAYVARGVSVYQRHLAFGGRMGQAVLRSVPS